MLAVGLCLVLVQPSILVARPLGELDEASCGQHGTADADRLPADGTFIRGAHQSELWHLAACAEVIDDDDDDDSGINHWAELCQWYSFADELGDNRGRVAALRQSALSLAPKTSPPDA